MINGEPELCPCQSGKTFATCCGPLLTGDKEAKTPESLMRSRYTAYVKRNTKYLINTWHPSTRPANIDSGSIPNWYNLIVKKKGQDGNKGLVEFIAVARSRNKEFILHEISHFVKEDGLWLYVDGDIIEPERTVSKVGRSDSCP